MRSENSILLSRMSAAAWIHVFLNFFRALTSVWDIVPTYYAVLFSNLYAVSGVFVVLIQYGGVCEFLLRTRTGVLDTQLSTNLLLRKKIVTWFENRNLRSGFIFFVILLSYWRKLCQLYLRQKSLTIFWCINLSNNCHNYRPAVTSVCGWRLRHSRTNSNLRNICEGKQSR